MSTRAGCVSTCDRRRPASGARDEVCFWSCQFEYGSTRTNSRCAHTCPAIVTASSIVVVKSVCAASPARCGCASVISCSGPRCGSPPPNAPLQRAQLPIGVTLGVLLPQQLEQCLRLELRRLREPVPDLRPVRLDRIGPRPPLARRHQLRWRLAVGHVSPRRRSVHARFHRGMSDAPVLAHSSISFLTCASLAGRTRPASPPRKEHAVDQ